MDRPRRAHVGARRRAWLSLTVAVAVASALSVRPGTASAAPLSGGTATTAAVGALPDHLGNAGRWLTDGTGRVVLIHGVNVPTKALPAYPAALGFGDDDAALLARLGFNAVRLTVERYALEPTPGAFDPAYVTQFAATMQVLARHGIMTLLDFHQDDFGPVFWDNGFPAWMTMTDGLPNLFFSPFPTQLFDNPALERAFDHLWANDAGPDGRPLQSDDAAMLAYVAGALRDQPGLLGYEVINEPWPGSAYPTCVGPTGCAAFDQLQLSAYYQRIAPAIRAADPAHFVWYEPLTTFNDGVPTYVIPPAVSRRGFAFHDYNLCGSADDAGATVGTYPPVTPAQTCQAEDALVFSNAIAHSAATGDPLLETEWGATMAPGTITQLADEYDQNGLPWLWWSYTRYVLKLAGDGTLLPAVDANVNWPVAGVLARPYPQLVSGTPLGWRFDQASKSFTFSWSDARADGGHPFGPGSTTIVSVPAVQYPGGYGVSVTGGRVVSAAGSGELAIASCPGFTTISVTVSNAPGPLPASCPG